MGATKMKTNAAHLFFTYELHKSIMDIKKLLKNADLLNSHFSHRLFVNIFTHLRGIYWF